MKNIVDLFKREKYTDKIIQFGEGNFLRSFVDWQIDILNEKTNFDGGIVIVRPINTEFPPLLNTQDGLYTTLIRGMNEKNEVVKDYRVIKSVNREIPIYKEYQEFLGLASKESFRYIFSNTTEAGITFDEKDSFEDSPASTFPAKLTRFLFERFRIFNGAKDKGFVIIPCELIDYNGDKLKEIIIKYSKLWNLGDSFNLWLEEANTFCSTLVDRIVTGYPSEELEEIQKEIGYKDSFITSGEYFYLFVIQGPKWLEEELKLNEIKLNIKIVDDIKPYKTRKVGLLNGAHTAMVPVSYLYGEDYVKESIENPVIGKFVKDAMFNEIIPAIEMDKTELEDFANSVISRFRNPYIKHKLMAISLNSMAKFNSRVMPQIISYKNKFGKFPEKLVFSLAGTMIFYKGYRNNETIDLKDDEHILDFYKNLWNSYENKEADLKSLANSLLAYEKNWGQDLSLIEGFSEELAKHLENILSKGMKVALEEISK